jgi:hypothetical protein
METRENPARRSFAKGSSPILSLIAILYCLSGAGLTPPPPPLRSSGKLWPSTGALNMCCRAEIAGLLPFRISESAASEIRAI